MRASTGKPCHASSHNIPMRAVPYGSAARADSALPLHNWRCSMAGEESRGRGGRPDEVVLIMHDLSRLEACSRQIEPRQEASCLRSAAVNLWTAEGGHSRENGRRQSAKEYRPHQRSHTHESPTHSLMFRKLVTRTSAWVPVCRLERYDYGCKTEE